MAIQYFHIPGPVATAYWDTAFAPIPGAPWVVIPQAQFQYETTQLWVAQGGFVLKVTRSATRQDPEKLHGKTLDTGKSYAVFVDDPFDLGITQVAFDLDTILHNTELSAPWDFNTTAGGGEANKYIFLPGNHTIDAHVTTPGGVVTLSASFVVD